MGFRRTYACFEARESRAGRGCRTVCPSDRGLTESPMSDRFVSDSSVQVFRLRLEITVMFVEIEEVTQISSPVEVGVAGTAELLEELWGLEWEVRCESVGPHDPASPDSVPCSVEVTHRMVSCAGGKLICWNVARAIAMWSYRGDQCGDGCGRSISTCWTVLPT